MNEHALSTRELATVLAALRLWQRTDSENTEAENVIATDDGRCDALNINEIDVLCERLNVAPTITSDVRAAEGLTRAKQASSADTNASTYRTVNPGMGWEAQDAALQEVENLRAACELSEAYLSVAEAWNAAGHHPTTFAPNITYYEAAERADINPGLRAPVVCLLTAGFADAWEWAHEIRNGTFPQLESLRRAVLDEAEFAAALQALRADPSIDDAKAAQIARAFTWNENAQFSSREEAFGVIAAKGSSWRTGVHQPPAESCVASYLDRLQTAGTHEGAFDQVFQALSSDGFMDTAQVSAIAAAYTGEGAAQYASRDEALGAIEGEFYARGQGQAQEQAAAQGGGRS